MPQEFRCAECGNKISPSRGEKAASCNFCGKSVHDDSHIISRIMPWSISVLFHVAVGVIFAFFTIMVINDSKGIEVVIPDAFMADNPGAVVNPPETSKNEKIIHNVHKTQTFHERADDFEIPIEQASSDEPITLIASAGGQAGTIGNFGVASAAIDKTGPVSSFGGLGGNAHHIVYVIDCSGSMVYSFPMVRDELLRSIALLKPMQDFHVILFSENKTMENPPRRLISPTDGNKMKLVDFLNGAVPVGASDPIPSIRKAFEVLSKADARRSGKLIYLLTDGEFTKPSQEVLGVIRDLNRKKEVKINTLLYGFQPGSVEQLMKEIANENGGRYRYIDSEE